MSIGSHVISISSDQMGSGDSDLGSILIKGFINTISKVSPLPKQVILYNSGVKLAVDNSAVIDSLNELEKLGVEILSCGTCADFYKIDDKTGAGKISNMLEILDALTAASKVITP